MRSLRILALTAAFLTALWWLPLTQQERFLVWAAKHGQWDACDQRTDPDRRFVVRLAGRLRPLLEPLVRRRREQVIRDFDFRLVRSHRESSAGLSESWEELRERALNAGNLFTIDHWAYWLADVDYLFDYEEGRLTASFVPIDFRRSLPFVPTTATVRTGPREISVFLDGHDFAPAREVLARAIEGAWSVDGWKLKVIWARDPRAYRLTLDPFAHFNSVESADHTLRLNRAITDGVLAHEVGHVLGFADHYNLFWNDGACAVVKSARYGDLMANSGVGRASPGHWALLDRAYPWPPRSGRQGKAFAYRAEEVFRERTIATK